MGELLENRIVQLVLGAIVVLIWGYNMLKIADIAAPSPPDNTASKITLDRTFFEIPEASEYHYQADFQDPFMPGLTRPAKKPVTTGKPASRPEPVRFPELKLTGVIEGTALLQNSRKEVFFSVPGDTVEGARVKSVGSDSVVMTLNSKEFTVTF